MKTIITNRQQLQKIINDISEEDFQKSFVLEISSIKKYKTDKQNKTFHSLLFAYFESGCSSFDNIIDLKNYYKSEMGMDVEYYVYFLEEEVVEASLKKKFPQPHKVINREDLPKEGVVAINKVYQSFSQATSTQVTTGIKALIRDIFNSGAESDSKIQDILKGLGEFMPSENIIDNIQQFFPNAKIL